MPNRAYWLCDTHMKDNIKEKAVILGFEDSEMIHHIFEKQIEDTIEKDLLDSLANKGFAACIKKMLGQKESDFTTISKITDWIKYKIGWQTN